MSVNSPPNKLSAHKRRDGYRLPYDRVLQLLRGALEDVSSIREAFRVAEALYNSSRTRSRLLDLTVEPERFDPEKHRFTYIGLPIPNPPRKEGGSPEQDEYLEVVLRVSYEYPTQLKHFEERVEDTEARIVEYRVRDPHTVYRTFIFFAAPGFTEGVKKYVEEYNDRKRRESVRTKDNRKIVLVDLRKKTLRQAVLETLVKGVDRGEDGKPLKPFLSWRVWRYLNQGDFEGSKGKVFGEHKDLVDILMLLTALLKRLDGGGEAVELAITRLNIAANTKEYEVEGYRDILRTLVPELEKLGAGMGRAAKPETASREEKPQTTEDFLLAEPDDPSRWEPVEDSEEVL